MLACRSVAPGARLQVQRAFGRTPNLRRSTVAMSSQQNGAMNKNVLGSDLTSCCQSPKTGFYRDGFCRVGPEDGECTKEFLEFSASRGNDLRSIVSPGQRWCLCVSRSLHFERCFSAESKPHAPVVRGLNDPAQKTPRCKLVLLGDSGVGKSCLVTQYARGSFDPDSRVTVGAAFMSQTVQLPEERSVKFEIWDTAGQERYASLANLYYRGANAACIVFDITNSESFKKAQHWANELQRNTSSSIVVMLVGNKKDLVSARAVQGEEAQEYADRMGMLFIEASAKSAEGVKDIFEILATKVLESQQQDSLPSA
eukprot:jgi/Astpho2/7985/Aster-06575